MDGRKEQEAEELAGEALERIGQAASPEELEALRVAFLGRKGRLAQAFRRLPELPAEERRGYGQRLNEAKERIEEALAARAEALAAGELEARLAREQVDVTLPGAPVPLGAFHPLRLAEERVESIMASLGYEIWEGPEVESDELNFTALNIPPDHPARDMQDTFYLAPGGDGGTPREAGDAGEGGTSSRGGAPGALLLRTHTSPGQIRYMRAHAPRLPVRMISPGRVYRRDDDARHSPVFHQVEGLCVDRGVSMADLKGTLEALARGLFGAGTRIRLRPSYFPFTEPSVEVDVSCTICGGEGCAVCGTGWLEILGAGMVHPVVLRNGGYDPEEASGFAFGLGIERVAMLLYRVDNIRLLYRNDLRWLEPFRGGRAVRAD
ncbi:MAG: phenylalanine--tRNA ligase subunit alpha [Bacillota bacterium]|nr:phenylalanine--tRNA ligase subunit alpha [Bacillota bacterium]